MVFSILPTFVLLLHFHPVTVVTFLFFVYLIQFDLFSASKRSHLIKKVQKIVTSFSDLWCVLCLFYLTSYDNLANLLVFLESTLPLCKLSVLLQEFTLLSLDFQCLLFSLTMFLSIPLRGIQRCIVLILSHLNCAHAHKDASSLCFPLLGILPH